MKHSKGKCGQWLKEKEVWCKKKRKWSKYIHYWKKSLSQKKSIRVEKENRLKAE